MKLFSMNWFRSNKEMEHLKIEEHKLKNEILQEELKMKKHYATFTEPKTPLQLDEKPYQRMKLVNNVITVTLNDGNILSKTNATTEDFLNIRECRSEKCVLEIMLDETYKKEREEKKQYVEMIENVLAHCDDFLIEEGSIYLKGSSGDKINRSIPPLLIKEFSNVVEQYIHPVTGAPSVALYDDERYNSLKKFWLKCCLNPNARSAEDLYEFLTHHNMKIDKHGNFYAYRRVVSVESAPLNKEFVDAVSNAYTKVKAVWKKKPVNYTMYKDGKEYKITDTFISPENGSYLGNLESLYLNLPLLTENRYTDAHTGTMDYRVGEVVSIPRDEGDDDNSRNCSRGLHSASKEYDYSGFGDTPILMIINPMDALAVPLNEVGKLRVCRFFFACTLSEDEKYILDEDDFDVAELGDIFEEKCLDGIIDYTHKRFSEEVKRHTFCIPNICDKDIHNIVHSLERMKEEMKNRVMTF